VDEIERYDGMGAVETFVGVIGNHCEQFGIPRQDWLIEGMRVMAKIIGNRESPRWLVRDAEWSLYDCLDRLIHDEDYLASIGLETQNPRTPISDEEELEIWAWLNQHAPEGRPTLGELKAEQRYTARGVKLVWSGSVED
jgi:hypothetical protein